MSLYCRVLSPHWWFIKSWQMADYLQQNTGVTVEPSVVNMKTIWTINWLHRWWWWPENNINIWHPVWWQDITRYHKISPPVYTSCSSQTELNEANNPQYLLMIATPCFCWNWFVKKIDMTNICSRAPWHGDQQFPKYCKVINSVNKIFISSQ